ncbi:hypothetical protein PQR14_25200 [Paraburkholderia bryophila]|uniref:hypothetical protein n=1 Tax=Paraburkholderia bryophila TaxID=420952 RepID=UPI0038B8BA74
MMQALDRKPFALLKRHGKGVRHSCHAPCVGECMVLSSASTSALPDVDSASSSS